MKMINKISGYLFSTRAAALYMLLFAASIGIATFIENDFGTSAAQKLIFKARWFELLLLLFSFCLVYNIYKFKFIQQKKWGTLVFHSSILIILLGSAITRYSGIEGIMHIREGDSQNRFLSSESFISMNAKMDGLEYLTEEKVLFASLGKNKFDRSYIIGSNRIDLSLVEFVPNPKETLIEDPQGNPAIVLVIGGASGREEYVIKYPSSRIINGVLFNFGLPEVNNAIQMSIVDDQLFFKSEDPISQMVMATQQRDTLAPDLLHPLLMRSLYSTGSISFVVSDFKLRSRMDIISTDEKMTNQSIAALKMKVKLNDKEEDFYISGSQGILGMPRKIQMGNVELGFRYGAKVYELPFSIKLRDFIMDRYPGTNSASSYASEVTLLDSRKNINEDRRIYMNNILDHDGYRFFQSSFDKDEFGTYLSVNRDAWGTRFSYLGYFLLTFGMILSLFHPASRLKILNEKIKSLRSQSLGMIFIIGLSLLASTTGNSQNSLEANIKIPLINEHHADLFGRLIVQDLNGRMKPVNTLSLEIIRKLSRKESLYNLNADQFLLSMSAYPEVWNKIPVIKLGQHEKFKQLFPGKSKLISYLDFFDKEGNYILSEQVRTAYNLDQINRGVFEKEIIKLDEKVNICNMIFSGSFMKLFPVVDHPNNLWEAPSHGNVHQSELTAESFPDKFYSSYIHLIRESYVSGKWDEANTLINELSVYQKNAGQKIIPDDNQIKAELWLNKLKVFSRLSIYYGLLSLLFLGLLFTSIFNPHLKLQIPFRICFTLFVIGFIFQTFGMALRWYVSERAPWSNGYESMIYIGWTTVLAGIIFSRKSLGGLTATTLLASIVLMVAGLSWLDPEITPLVPVLNSYWLTIHVSLEAGSYGFLVLGALIGALNLILMILRTKSNKDRMDRIISEMSYTSEITLIGGLIMISTGTYLGGVWANESWGRYWGWDAKETWALVSILVYSFILHMRLIPGLQSKFAYNTASLFGFASVLMTYLGVNYYLSGLHSYAAGDPVPIPAFVYYLFFGLVTISVLAYWRNKQMEKN